MLTLTETEMSLDEALNVVSVEGLKLKSVLQKGQITDAIVISSNITSILRITNLNVKEYFQLFLSVSEQLSVLKKHLIREFKQTDKSTIEKEKANCNENRQLDDIYYLVQDIKLVVSRLYVAIVVGTVYFKLYNENNILFDLLDMCRCVQEPQRGMFIRYFFLKSIDSVMPKRKKNKENLNESNESIEITVMNEKTCNGNAGHMDWLYLILTNFKEMNKLWLRMNYDGHNRDKTFRDQARVDIRSVVAANVCYLSQLECLNYNVYKKKVLPEILLQLVSCQDALAQSCTMECVFEVFDEKYHVESLDTVMTAISKFTSGISIPKILKPFIDKLVNSSILSCVDSEYDSKKFFTDFASHIKMIQKTHISIRLSEVISIKILTIKLALSLYKDNITIADSILQETCDILKESSVPSQTTEITRKVVTDLILLLVSNIKSFFFSTNLSRLIFGGPWVTSNGQISAVVEIVRNISSFGQNGKFCYSDFYQYESEKCYNWNEDAIQSDFEKANVKNAVFCIDSDIFAQKVVSFISILFSLNCSEPLELHVYECMRATGNVNGKARNKNAAFDGFVETFNAKSLLQLLEDLMDCSQSKKSCRTEKEFVDSMISILNVWKDCLKNCNDKVIVASSLKTQLTIKLVYKYTQLINQCMKDDCMETILKIMEICKGLILDEVKIVDPRMAHNLIIDIVSSLVCIHGINQQISEIAFECLCDAFLIFDEDISHSSQQTNALFSVINVLHKRVEYSREMSECNNETNNEMDISLSGFTHTDMDTIIAQIQSRAGRLLNRESQINVLCSCSFMCVVLNKHNLVLEKVEPRIARTIAHNIVQRDEKLLIKLKMIHLTNLAKIVSFIRGQDEPPNFSMKMQQKFDITRDQLLELCKEDDDDDLKKRIDVIVESIDMS